MSEEDKAILGREKMLEKRFVISPNIYFLNLYIIMMFICRKTKLRWLKIEQRLVDLDIAVKTSLHLESPMADQVRPSQTAGLSLYSNLLFSAVHLSPG